MHKVFVYGTLKKGQPNHYYLTEKGNGVSRFYASGMTVDRYPLVIASYCNIPCILDKKGVGHVSSPLLYWMMFSKYVWAIIIMIIMYLQRLFGEVYEVDDAMLACLDELERVGENYAKLLLDIELLHPPGIEPKIQPITTYVIQGFHPELLQLQFHSNYDSFGDHGLRYVGSKDRKTFIPRPFTQIKMNYPENE